MEVIMIGKELTRKDWAKIRRRVTRSIKGNFYPEYLVDEVNRRMRQFQRFYRLGRTAAR